MEVALGIDATLRVEHARSGSMPKHKTPPIRGQFARLLEISAKGGMPGGGDSRLRTALFKEIAREKLRVRLGDDVRIPTRADAVFHVNYAASLKKNANATANMFLLAEEARELPCLGIARPTSKKYLVSFRFADQVGECR
jgi:hypothetical protein